MVSENKLHTHPLGSSKERPTNANQEHVAFIQGFLKSSSVLRSIWTDELYTLTKEIKPLCHKSFPTTVMENEVKKYNSHGSYRS